MGTIKTISLLLSLFFFVTTTIATDGFSNPRKSVKQTPKRQPTVVNKERKLAPPAPGNFSEVNQLNEKIRNLEKDITTLTLRNNNLSFQVETQKKEADKKLDMQLAKLAENTGNSGSTVFLTFIILFSVTALFLLLKRETQIETRIQEAQHKRTRAAIREVFTQLTTGGSGFLQSAISSLKEPLDYFEEGRSSDNKRSSKRQDKQRPNNELDDVKPSKVG